MVNKTSLFVVKDVVFFKNGWKYKVEKNFKNFFGAMTRTIVKKKKRGRKKKEGDKR